MDELFQLRIIATNKSFYEGKAKSLVIPTSTGERGILAHHAGMMCAINMGELRFQTDGGEWRSILVGAGSMSVNNNQVLVLVDTVETLEEIDIERAEQAIVRAQERMRQKQSQRQYMMSQAAMARALSRLKYKDKNH